MYTSTRRIRNRESHMIHAAVAGVAAAMMGAGGSLAIPAFIRWSEVIRDDAGAMAIWLLWALPVTIVVGVLATSIIGALRAPPPFRESQPIRRAVRRPLARAA